MSTPDRAGRRPATAFAVALGWAVATWVTVALVTDVDEDTAALWIGVALTLVGPPVLITLAVWPVLAARRAGAAPAPGPFGYAGAILLLTALVALAGAGAFLYPFNTDGSRAPVLAALAVPWYLVGVLAAVAGVAALGAALVVALRAGRQASP